jgi:glyoxylase-like metal-dependent hydrolase (beta-lactamase superfamily II)
VKPIIHAFFNEPTNTVSYLIADPASGAAAVVDPVLDYDAEDGTVDTASAEAILAKAEQLGWTIELVLETHAHADHLSAAPLFQTRTGARIGIGERIRDVQKIFRPMFGADDVKDGGGDFDLLFKDGERIALGGLTIEVMAVPGHTAADVAYRIDDSIFVGDSLFMPDFGTARTDFPGGDARQLYRSIQRILALPPETRLFMCHDYKAPGRDTFAWETTVAEQRAANVHVGGGTSEDDFVAMREARDKTLDTPKLLLPAIQVNIRAGRFPPAEANGVSYLRIPVRVRG